MWMNLWEESCRILTDKIQGEYEMSKKIYIVGAHSRGQTVAFYLTYLNPQIEIEAYLIDNDEPNPKQVNGVPVIKLEKGTKLHNDYPVYIGTRGVYHPHFVKCLEKQGMKEIHPVSVELDMELRNAFLKKYFESKGKEYKKIEGTTYAIAPEQKVSVDFDSCVYVANSAFDKALESEYCLAPYERTIQVGAALTERRILPDVLTDDAGENISKKNRQFCELTALYWIWKNAKEDVVGLVHYRRHFILPSDWEKRMKNSGIDVILPIPLYVLPNVEENYKKRHDPGDWEYMMHYIKEKDSEEYEDMKKVFGEPLYSPCNMFIMRREVLLELCQWMFPILDAVVEHGGQKEDPYFNRYPGFLSERLITYYFQKHSEKYKVVYADKNFLL